MWPPRSSLSITCSSLTPLGVTPEHRTGRNLGKMPNVTQKPKPSQKAFVKQTNKWKKKPHECSLGPFQGLPRFLRSSNFSSFLANLPLLLSKYSEWITWAKSLENFQHRRIPISRTFLWIFTPEQTNESSGSKSLNPKLYRVQVMLVNNPGLLRPFSLKNLLRLEAKWGIPGLLGKVERGGFSHHIHVSFWHILAPKFKY